MKIFNMFRDSIFIKIKTNLEYLDFGQKSDKIQRRTSIKQLNGVTKPYSKEVNTFLSLYVSFFLYVVVSLQ